MWLRTDCRTDEVLGRENRIDNFADLIFDDIFLPAHGDLQPSIWYILEFAINQFLELFFAVGTFNTINRRCFSLMSPRRAWMSQPKPRFTARSWLPPRVA